MAHTTRTNTDAKVRDGVTRSSVEAPVMGVERRGGIIEPVDRANLAIGMIL